MRKKDDVYYGTGDEERLSAKTKEEAIEELLYRGVDKYTDEVAIFRYERVKVKDVLDYMDVLTEALEKLDEELGDPEAPTDPCEDMVKLAFDFTQKIEELYVPFICEGDNPEVVNLKDYKREHQK